MAASRTNSWSDESRNSCGSCCRTTSHTRVGSTLTCLRPGYLRMSKGPVTITGQLESESEKLLCCGLRLAEADTGSAGGTAVDCRVEERVVVCGLCVFVRHGVVAAVIFR